jgi:Na+-translocating ferredoxin:NAD+ oxidoreductase subunit B
MDISALLSISLMTPVLFFSSLAIVFGVTLSVIAQKFPVDRDPLINGVYDALARAHCGACGFAGCEQYADAVVKNPEIAPDLCTPGGAKTAAAVAKLTGKSPAVREARHAFVMCQGGGTIAARSFVYRGVRDCRAAALISGGGDVSCRYGCLGLGTCAAVCPFDAIAMGPAGLPSVNTERCTACGSCVQSCPRGVIELLPASASVLVACHSTDAPKSTRLRCTSGCIGCGACRKICPVEAPTIKDNLSIIDYSACTACGLCVEKCPAKSIIRLKSLSWGNDS